MTTPAIPSGFLLAKPTQPAPSIAGKGKLAISPSLPGATTTKVGAGYRIDVPLAVAAQAFRVQATQENMVAFLGWIKAFDRPGVLGPVEFKTSDGAGIKRDNANDPALLRRLQAGLARRGYNVQATGSWDAATAGAVVQFKHARGLHEPFKTPDGKWAITPFADEALIQLVAG
jgi:hypothetical protein